MLGLRAHMELWRLLLLVVMWNPTEGQDLSTVSQVSCVFMKSCLLPCSFEDEEDDEMSLIEWIKIEGDYLVHAYQPGRDLMAKQSAPFRGRTALFMEQISGGNVSLQLSAVTVEDQGTYRCLAVTTTEAGVEEWISLRVEGPVAAVKMELRGAVLVCSAEGIYPQPDVSWDPPAVPKTKRPPEQNGLYSVSSSLPLDLRSTQTYTCNVSTYHSWKSATYSLQPPVKMSGNSTIPCVISVVPERSLVWTFIDRHTYVETIMSRSGAEVECTAPWRPFVAGVSDSGSLTLKELSQEQEGVYICELHTRDHTYFSRTELRPDDPGSNAVVIAVPVTLAALAIIVASILVVSKKKNGESKEKKPKQPPEDQILAKQRSGRHPHGEIIKNMKSALTDKFRCFNERLYDTEKMEVDEYLTELFIIPKDSVQDNEEHEVIQMETHFKEVGYERTVSYQDIFKESTRRGEPVRVVLTKGLAGLGKKVLTHKFCRDWGENRANQDIQLLFPFTFRELNVLKDTNTQFSLVELLHYFFSETKDLCSFQQLKVLFIFERLDECRLLLDFSFTKKLTDPTKPVSVEMLLVNLIQGNLLPSAQLWITTRPSGASQIPSEYISMLTEVRGFNDLQKQQYFRNRFKEQDATAIISHIKNIRSLHIMCSSPFFCYIISSVMHYLMESGPKDEFPQTLTHVYIYFLIVLKKAKSLVPERMRSLGKLAFEQLQKKNLIFCESDLRDCGLDNNAASEYSSVFPQIFREESNHGQDKIYSFIHLSVQEFLAALHVHDTFISSGENLLSKQSPGSPISEAAFYSSAVQISLQSPNGHLGLFVRFLLGLSLPTNQKLLSDSLGQTGTRSLIKQNLKPGLLTQHESTSNQSLLQSLLQDTGSRSPSKQNLKQGLQTQDSSTSNQSLLPSLLETGSRLPSNENLQPGLLTQGRSKSNPSLHSSLQIETGSKLTKEQTVQYVKMKLNDQIPQVSAERCLNLLHCLNELNDHSLLEEIRRWMKEGVLSDRVLSPAQWSALCFILLSSDSDLELFDLRKYQTSDDALLKLILVVKASNKAILCGCNLSLLSCERLASALSFSRMTLLDLSYNNLQDAGVEQLCEGVKSPTCRLQILRLSHCNLSHRSCGSLASVLSSSSLTELDLSNNDLHDSGVEQLCSGLNGGLQILRLSGCLVATKGGASLASALSSVSSKLTELDLRYNHPGTSKGQLAALGAPHGPLDTRLEPVGEGWLVPGLRKYFSAFTLDPNTVDKELHLSDDRRTVTCVKEICPHDPSDHDPSDRDPSDPEDRLADCHHVLSSTSLHGRHYWEVSFSCKGTNVEKNIWVTITVSNRDIGHGGEGHECNFGNNDQSWTLWIWRRQYYVCHNKKRRKVFDCPILSDHRGVVTEIGGRVGVFSDSEAGQLSFFRVEKEKLIHLHTFSGSFTEPVFPGFGLRTENVSVSLVNPKSRAAAWANVRSCSA